MLLRYGENRRMANSDWTNVSGSITPPATDPND
jgi:hypothetical protein